MGTPSRSNRVVGTRSPQGTAVPANRQTAQSGPRRLLFAAYHCLVDPSSGAAISARELLHLLATAGWYTQVFCGPMLDFGRPESPVQILVDEHIEAAVQHHRPGDTPAYSTASFQDGPICSSLFLPHEEQRIPSRPVGAAFLARLDAVVRTARPDFLLTYGGYWLASPILALARRYDVKTVFWLRNFAYKDRAMFDGVDLTIVPSVCSQQYYRTVLNVDSTVIPSPINWRRVTCKRDPDRRFVTFVNPQPHKGVFVFARIAAELGRRRPDIPLLIVEGRAGIDRVARTGVDLNHLTNVHVMANTPDPRDFYRITHVMLMPSLWRESFGRVAAEAMTGGIPVLGTDRGALPELLDGAGLMLPVPDQYTPESRVAPSAEEVLPWVNAIIRLWDDPSYYEEISERCRTRAEMWRPSVLLPPYIEAFESLLRG